MKFSYVQETSFESMFWTFFSLSLKKVYTSQFRFSTVFRFIKMFIKTLSLSGQNRAQNCNTLGHKQRLSLVRIGQKSALLLYFWICHKIDGMSQRVCLDCFFFKQLWNEISMHCIMLWFFFVIPNSGIIGVIQSFLGQTRVYY